MGNSGKLQLARPSPHFQAQVRTVNKAVMVGQKVQSEDRRNLVLENEEILKELDPVQHDF